MNWNKMLFFVAGCFYLVSTVSCLRCYVCNSYYEGEYCSSSEKLKENPKFIRNCSDLPEGERYTYCRKMIQHDIPSNNGQLETRIVRECGFLNTTFNSCQKIGMNDIGRQITCSCSEDECNGSSQLKAETSILSLLVLGVFSLIYSSNV